MRLIKRYENRKLYDTQAKKYISLPALAELIRSGEQVSVVEKNTNADITAQTLTQIILDEGKKGNSAIPSEVLHEMIRWGSGVVNNGIEQVKQGVDQLVRDSFNRILPQRKTADIAELQKRIDTLETMISELLEMAGAGEPETN